MKIFQGRRMRKSASLQISINAIVILVMAMVVLGVGLSFIRGLIGQGQKQLGKAIINADLRNPATADNPLTVDKLVEMKSGKSTTMHIGWYNPDVNPATVNPGAAGDGSVDIDCSDGTGGTAAITLAAPEAVVNGGEAQGWEAIVTDTSTGGLDPGFYSCGFAIYGSAGVVRSGSFTVSITN